MKLEVIAVFRDKFTNNIYKIGETLETDELRGADLIARGFAAAANEPTAEKPKASTKKKAGGGSGRSNNARKD